MEMDGRDSAKCQNWGKKGHRWHYRICLNDNKTKKKENSVVFSNCKRSQKCEEPKNWSNSWRFHFLV